MTTLSDKQIGQISLVFNDGVPDFVAFARAVIAAHEQARGQDSRTDRMEDALHKIKTWSEAYPLTVFPEPDFKRAHEVLTAAGMTLDAISAHNMRHVITKVQGIVDAALAGAGESK